MELHSKQFLFNLKAAVFWAIGSGGADTLILEGCIVPAPPSNTGGSVLPPVPSPPGQIHMWGPAGGLKRSLLDGSKLRFMFL